ncbi:DUF2958 domain-containing protein [Pararhizobium sp. A13]|uniref:DUF2958 domain-containing protein n=1 Tax=Pararhizobium sp. A13 TaxID=3133975 RepID=UPI00311AE647
MQLIIDNIRTRLLENGARFAEGPDFDPVPVFKLFTPDGAATWLIASAEPDEPDILFGLCDLGVGFPELGSVRLSEIENIRGLLGLPVERDLGFRPSKPISAYTSEAITRGTIVS